MFIAPLACDDLSMSEVQHYQQFQQEEEYLFRDAINRHLLYIQETGEFFWKKTTGRAIAGMPAGTIHPRGYKKISFQGKGYFAHRLAWLFVHGNFPVNFIDHIDGNKLNNRINNLRPSSTKENLQNQKRARSDNTCLLLGVGYHKASGMFRARITKDGKQKHLGLFESAEDAHEAYLKEKRKLHEFCTI